MKITPSIIIDRFANRLVQKWSETGIAIYSGGAEKWLQVELMLSFPELHTNIWDEKNQNGQAIKKDGDEISEITLEQKTTDKGRCDICIAEEPFLYRHIINDPYAGISDKNCLISDVDDNKSNAIKAFESTSFHYIELKSEWKELKTGPKGLELPKGYQADIMKVSKKRESGALKWDRPASYIALSLVRFSSTNDEVHNKRKIIYCNVDQHVDNAKHLMIKESSQSDVESGFYEISAYCFLLYCYRLIPKQK